MFPNKNILKLQINCQSCSNKNCFAQVCLSDSELYIFNEKKKVNLYIEGDFIFKQDSIPESVFIVLNGSIDVISQDSNGQVTSFYTASRGHLLGYRSLILEEPHSASALVVKRSEICTMQKEDFLEPFTKNETLGLKFINFITLQEKDIKNNQRKY